MRFVPDSYRIGSRFVLEWYQIRSTMCNIGTKCVPDWYQIGTRFVLDWYRIGTTMVPDGRQMGARSASDKSLSPLLVHPDTDKAGDIFHCCVHRDLVHLAISASRCYAPVLTKDGAPRPCRRRTGSLVHFCILLYEALCLFRVRDLLKKRRTRQWLNLEVARCGAAVRLKIVKPTATRLGDFVHQELF